MKLGKTAVTYNLGDTSFRRKSLIDDYRILLNCLQKINFEFPRWNEISQKEFYKSLLKYSDLFSRDNENESNFAQRGRTATNALVKLGLTDDNRKLSQVSKNWLSGKTKQSDDIEKTLGIDINNLLFLRQLLKLRLYDKDGIHYFYPFRFAIKLTSLYSDIPQDDFLTLVHLIKPTFTKEIIESILQDYNQVANNDMAFFELIEKYFPEENMNINKSDLESFFSKYPLDRGVFNQLFVNRKSSSIQDEYYQFIDSLLIFKNEKNKTTLKSLLSLSKKNSIKKAFGFGKNVFQDAKSINDFFEKNSDHLLLSSDNKNIYSQFALSKKKDIIKEYKDMTKRTFNLTGILDFSNGLVNATNQELFQIIFSDLILNGIDPISNYEDNLSSKFYQENTLIDIIDLDEVDNIDKIKEIFGVVEINQVEKVVKNRKEEQFRKFIEKNFPKEKILKILSLFSVRNDKSIHDLVTDVATIPTIFEYIVAITWYYISKEEFFLTESLNLTLDGDFRPLSHAVGGAGDIVIEYSKLTLMLEVTLMNRQAQKRGEWEPVLRHATNLTVDKYPKNVTTLFIADELDENTVNIWRAVASVPLKHSSKDEYAELVKIFPLTINELINILQNDLNEHKLFEKIDSSYADYANQFDLAWRDNIMYEFEGNMFRNPSYLFENDGIIIN